MTGQIQDRNSQMVDNLRADLQPRYEPNFAWKGITGLYQALPALLGFWPMSAQTTDCQTWRETDIANRFDLTPPVGAPHGYDDLIPYVSFDGSTQYLYYVDSCQFSIAGTESVVEAKSRGLTLGCWVKPSAIAGVQSLIAKWLVAGNQQSYMLKLIATGAPQLDISVDGTAVASSTSTALAVADDWWFIAGRFIPATSITVWCNGTQTVAATAAASIFNSNAHLNVGASENGTLEFYGGLMSMAWICAAALSDSIITAIWQQTRAMFRR